MVSPPPVRFSAVIPPGAPDVGYFISTTGLTMTQSFDREPATLLVGEAFVRTITVKVTDALSMVVPPLAAVANAVKAATGVRMTRLPMSPPAVLAALDEARDGGGEA